ncbi:alpha-L-rhamnosidase [bacterium]|nr:alpha-L-rhamnosidase [bacterium]
MVTKLFPPRRLHLGNAGILPIHPIDEAAWIWDPAAQPGRHAFLRFTNGFASDGTPLIIHVSADQRYVLSLDGSVISRGPDRCDPEHWAFASYRIELAPGAHTLEAFVWHVGSSAALAQLSVRGGFILRAEGAYNASLSTGSGPWQVERLDGLEIERQVKTSVFGLGGVLKWDGTAYPWQTMDARPAAVVAPALKGNKWGCADVPWKLVPSVLPDQLNRLVHPGTAVAAGDRALKTGWDGEAFVREDLAHPLVAQWQRVIEGTGPLTVPAHSSAFLLWYLGDYYCGYPHLDVSGGAHSTIAWLWEEGLFDAKGAKGSRTEVVGRHAIGFGDTFVTDGGARRVFTSHWWRGGTFCILKIATSDEPLELNRLGINETRYPLEAEGAFACDGRRVASITPLCIRGIQMCSHETFMDCPHYEQLMYVGDTRLEMLVTHVLTRDDRLVKRGIELFDWSRINWGFVNERYPSQTPQLSTTFSMIWALMLRDYCWWRNDAEFVKARMIGLRAMLEHFEPYINGDGLLEALPGWSFMDWVNEWDTGYTPTGRFGVCSVVNLLFVLALRSAAELEDWAGEPLLARRLRERARRIAARVVKLFWNEKRGLIADDPDQKHFSEHAQIFALLTDAVTGARASRVFNGLVKDRKLARASYYFTHYLFEVFRKMHRPDLLLKHLGRWDEMVHNGCSTPLEKPDPSRSDCHAWSSHPLFHFHATLTGIRPGSPGFRTVVIEPQMGTLKQIECRTPHPDGEIVVELKRKGKAGCAAVIELPEGVTGTFIWQGKRRALKADRTELSLA